MVVILRLSDSKPPVALIIPFLSTTFPSTNSLPFINIFVYGANT